MREFKIYHCTENRFEELEDQPRKYTDSVHTDNLEMAFRLSQNVIFPWSNQFFRSTSVGDVIQDGDQNYMVCGIGFKLLETPLTIID
jgi:hypothetical protein